MRRFRVSVAMCTYNGGRYIQEQLESMLAQTRLPDELVVCDDISNDGTFDLLRSFVIGAPFRVRLFRNQGRLGPAKNFEKAIRLCNGEIIVLSDQDDLWSPSKIKELLKTLEQNPDSVYVFSDAEMMDEGGVSMGKSLWDSMGIRSRLERFSGPEQLKILLRKNVVVGATVAFRAYFRDSFLPIPAGWVHDHWIACLGSALYSGVPVAKPLVAYRCHPSQVCGEKKKTILQVLHDSLESGREDSLAKFERLRKLSDRIRLLSQAIRCPPERLRLIQDKELHLSERAAIRGGAGRARIARVIAEMFTGRYQLYSNSWTSVVRDLWILR